MYQSARFMRFRTLFVMFGLAGLLLSAPAAVARPASAAPAAGTGLNWRQYLQGPQHSSVSLATAFTPSNAASASQVWHWQPPAVTGKPPPRLEASPTVAAGRVYIGAESGGFYALSEATGAVVWSRQLDTEPNVTCPARGITSTAAVQPDPVTGTSTVYVSGARYLYARNAATGALIWKTEIGPPSLSSPDAYYNWSSPTVAGGHIYAGLSSSCDKPLIRGGLVELDQHTGHVLRTWHTVPSGSLGGSIWSSAAATSSGGGVWVSTGNECDPTINTCPAGNQIGHSLSIVHLSSSLALLQAWPATAMTGTSAPHRPCSAAAARRPAWAPATRTAGTTPLPQTRWAAPRCGQTRSAPPRNRATRACPAPSGTGRPAPFTSAAIPPPSAAPATADRSARSTRQPAPTSGRPACPAR